MNENELEEKAVQQYNDPKVGLWGKTKMMRKYRKVLNNMYALQRHRETNARMIRKLYRHIKAPRPFHSVQVDLADLPKLQNPSNKNVRYLFMCIDVFSRYLWVKPLTSKASLHKPLEDIIIGMKTQFNKTPVNMTGDNEFATTKLQYLAGKYDFKWYFSDPGEKNRTGIVERSIRTLRNLIKRYLTQYDTTKYIDVLDTLVYNYNHTYHRTIRKTPHEAMMSGKTNLNYKPKEIPALKRQQKVRIQEIRKKGFTKGDVPYYSKDVFKIIGRDMNRYILKNARTNDVVPKKYSRAQLYKIDKTIPPLKRKKNKRSSRYDDGIKEQARQNALNKYNKKHGLKPTEIQRMDKIDEQIDRIKHKKGMQNKLKQLQKKKDKEHPSVPLPPIDFEDDQKMSEISNEQLERERANRFVNEPKKIPKKNIPKNIPKNIHKNIPKQPLRRSNRLKKPPDRYIPQDFRRPPKVPKRPPKVPKRPPKVPKRPPKVPQPPPQPGLRRSSRIRKAPDRYVPIDFRKPKKRILKRIKNKGKALKQYAKLKTKIKKK